MNLTPHDHMARALDEHPHALPDLDRLVTGSRAAGARSRRRRRAGAAGVLAAAVAIGAVGVTIGSGSDPDPARTGVTAAGSQPAAPSTTPSTPPTPPGPATSGPATARGLTAALEWAVDQESDGTASDYEGQQTTIPGVGGTDAGFWLGAFTFQDGAGASEVSVNVVAPGGIAPLSTCRPDSRDCQVDELPGGGTIKSSQDRTSTPDGVGKRASLTYARPDGVTVSLSATNGLVFPASRWDLTRDEPALTTEQLRRIALLDFWGTELPQGFLDAGRDLEPFELFVPQHD